MKSKNLIIIFFILNLISVSIKAQNNDIEVLNGAILHPNGYSAYFFVGQWFHEYNINEDKLTKIGKIGKDAWSGLSTNVDAALMHPANGKGYIFKGNQYYRYNFKTRKVEKRGTIGVDGWEGLEGPIDAALVHPVNKMAYFFKGKKYYRYNFSKGKIDKIATIGVDGWKGIPAKVDAAIIHKNGKAYFFKDDNYYRYDFSKKRVDKISVIGKDGWKNLFFNIDAANGGDFFRGNSYYYTTNKVSGFGVFASNKIIYNKRTIGDSKYEGVPGNLNAVLTQHINKKIYLFKGAKYYRYDKNLHKIDKIGTIGTDVWKGVPVNIDAAVSLSNKKAYFFKGTKYYRFNYTTNKVDKIGLIKTNWKGVPDNIDAVQSGVDDEKFYLNNADIILFYKKSIEYVYSTKEHKVIEWHFIPYEKLR